MSRSCSSGRRSLSRQRSHNRTYSNLSELCEKVFPTCHKGSYGDEMLVFAQTDPAWEYWSTGTYLAIAIGATLIATVATWLIYRYWQKTKGGNDRLTD